jgi:hypothetical protein
MPKPKDARETKTIEEQETPKPTGAKEPKEGRDPKDRSRTPPEDGSEEDPKGRTDVPAWLAALPPEIREAVQNAEYEKVPASFRDLIARYMEWIQTREGREDAR